MTPAFKDFKEEDKTDWFSRDVMPVRAGVYECRWRELQDGQNMPFPYHYFDGQRWCVCIGDAPHQFTHVGLPAPNGKLPGYAAYWRGLKEKTL